MLKRAIALSLVLIISRTVLAKDRCRKSKKEDNPIVTVVKGTGKAVGTIVETTGEIITAPFGCETECKQKCKTKKCKKNCIKKECPEPKKSKNECKKSKKIEIMKPVVVEEIIVENANDEDIDRTCCDTKTHEIEVC